MDEATRPKGRGRNSSGQWAKGGPGRSRCDYEGCERFAHARGRCYRHDPCVVRQNPMGYHGKWTGVVCTSEGCDRPVSSKGLCVSHYHRAKWASGHRAPSSTDAEKVRDAKLRHRYGISAADYDRQFAAQRGVCAICRRGNDEGSPKHWKALAVDHCHETGRVRGLLCNNCNLIVGRGRDIEVLKEAIRYLRRDERNGRVDPPLRK